MFPPLPPLSGLHVLVIHFPIALLLIAPVFILLSLLIEKHRLVWASAAMTLMVLGTLAACVATFTGEQAEDGIDLPDAAGPVLEHHEHLAETARNLFIGLTVAYAGVLIYNRFRNHMKWHLFGAITAGFLLLYGAATLVLVNAAHQGGRLVHEFGVRSPVAETATTQPATE
jgi:uncharacterized membrane protein